MSEVSTRASLAISKRLGTWPDVKGASISSEQEIRKSAKIARKEPKNCFIAFCFEITTRNRQLQIRYLPQPKVLVMHTVRPRIPFRQTTIRRGNVLFRQYLHVR